MKINVGVIGAGRWGPNIINAIERVENSKVWSVYDSNLESLCLIKKKFPSIRTSSFDDMLNCDSISAIAICTPVETHTTLAKSAINAGKHVFVEKPFGLNVKDCKLLCQMAREKDLHILVGHVFLFNASIIALKEIIDSGELGKIMHMEAHRTNLGPVRKDVNSVWDLTSHDLSIFDYLLDDLPVAVSCLGSCKLDDKIADTAYTTFRYKNDILAHAHSSWLNPRKVRQITVIGDQKMVLWDDLNLEHPITIYDSSIGLDQSYYSDSFASHRLSYNRGPVTLPKIGTNEPLLDEMKHFIEVIRGKSKNRCSGEYGTEVANTLQAADQSITEEGKFITVKR